MTEYGQRTSLPETCIQRMAFALVFIFSMGLWSCATTETGEAVRPWSCDEQADRAVTAGDWDQALTRHQAYLAVRPDDCLAIYHLGYIWGRLGDRDKEIAQFERAAGCGYNKDDQLYFNLGMAYAEMNRLEDAIAAFNRAIALNPDNADNYFGLGLTAISAGRTEMALAALARAVKIDPGHWDARIELARLELDLDRLESARVQLEAVQKGAPDHEALQTLWRIYHDRKITAFDGGKSDR